MNELIPYIKDNVYKKHLQRDDYYLHASDLTFGPEFCPRELALKRELHKPLFITLAQKVTFDIGRDIEARVQNEYLRSIGYGKWNCNCTVYFGGYPNTCPNCGMYFKYNEPFFPGEGYTCSVDYVIRLGYTLHLVEIKSIGKDAFLTLSAPKKDHSRRMQLYLHAAPECLWDLPLSKTAHILYISKGYGDKDASGHYLPFKSFPISYNPESITDLLDHAKEYVVAKLEGRLPVGICESMYCARANKCLVSKECFLGANSEGFNLWE